MDSSSINFQEPSSLSIFFERWVMATSRPSSGGEESMASVCWSTIHILKSNDDNALARERPTGPEPIIIISYFIKSSF